MDRTFVNGAKLMTPSQTAAVASLTDRERECLRLVLSGWKSKEIGLRLGLSNHTVDNYLRAATNKLGVSSRTEAARILAAAETRLDQPLIDQAGAIATPACPPPPDLSTDDREGRGDRVRDAAGDFQSVYLAPPRPPALWPFPTEGRKRNDLTAWQRIGWIVAITIATAVVTGSFISGAEALGRIGLAATSRAH